MSWQAVTYAVDVIEDHPELTTLDRLVLVLLAEHASRTGVAWPSSATLARKCGVRDDAVRRALMRIAATGAVQPCPVPGRPTRWRFPLSTAVALEQHPADVTRGARATPLLLQGNTPVAPGQHEPVKNRLRTNARAAHGWCDDSCPSCAGDGWIEVAPRTSAPCPNRRTA